MSNDSGNLAGANVNNVNVNCTTTYSVGENVTGLATGNSLVLQSNAGDNATITADGVFTFPSALADGSAYAVTVLTQPTTPNQTCMVANGSGNLTGTNVSNINESCSINPMLNFSDSTATGTGVASATISNCGGPSCGFVATSTITPTAPTSNSFVHGLCQFKPTQCLPGATVEITLTLPEAAFPAGTQFWKFGPPAAGLPNQWY